MFLREHMWGGDVVGHNWGWQFGGIGFGAGVVFGVLLLAVGLWTLYWKYKAIWYAVKHEHRVWMLIFLLVNTLGVLEILYLHVFSKYHKS